ncbi:MAG: hypothetical protein AB3N14_01560 [Flavobacteriaceae bacterium]
MVEAIMKNLCRFGEDHYLQQILTALFPGARGVFAHPSNFIENGVVNYSLRYKLFFTRDIRILVSKHGRSPSGWPEEFVFPLLHIISPEGKANPHSKIQVDFPHRGIAHLTVSPELDSPLCVEHFVGEQVRQLPDNVWGTMENLPALEDMFRLDPMHPEVISRLGYAQLESEGELNEAESLQLSFNSFHLKQRIEEASTRLVNLRRVYQMRYRTKVELHFPLGDCIRIGRKWDRWRVGCENAYLSLKDRGVVHPDCKLWEAAEAFRSETAPLSPLLRNIVKQSFGSAMDSVQNEFSYSLRMLERLQNLHHQPLLKESREAGVNLMALSGLWQVLQEMLPEPWVNLDQFGDRLARKLRSLFHQDIRAAL